MPIKVGEFFKAQAVKAGVDLAAENNKAFVDLIATLDAEVPDHVAGLINSALISIKEAKNNHGELKNHYMRETLDALDQSLDEQMKKYGFPQADIDELKLERSSYKRQALLVEKVQKLTEAKALETKPDQKKTSDMINALNAELAAEKAKPAQIQATYEQKIKDLQVNYGKTGLFRDYKTVYDTLPGDARNVGLNSLLDSRLAAEGAKLELNDAGEIVLVSKDGHAFHDKTTNTPLNAKQFVEKALADSKLLVTNQTGQNSGSEGSNSSNGQTGNNGQQGNQNRNNGGQGNQQSNDSVTNAIAEFNKSQIDAFKNAPAI